MSKLATSPPEHSRCLRGPVPTLRASPSASVAAWHAYNYGAFVSDHGPDRLIADTKLGGQRAETPGCGQGADNHFLVRRELASACDTEDGRDCHAVMATEGLERNWYGSPGRQVDAA